MPDFQRATIRLLPDQHRRVARAARLAGMSQQRFMEAAIMAEVGEVEERQRVRKEGRLDGERARQTTAPVGLGLATARPSDQATLPLAVEAMTPPPVAVHVNTLGGGRAGDVIEHLAAFVLAGGSDFDREARKRTAVNVLRASAESDQERLVMAARLDEVIAQRTHSTTRSDRGGIVSLDKLKALVRGLKGA